ncbi:questin oxidase family protein [Pseudoalteromonas byunsanensis]|uniref:DUF4243 domain-containing protein n=1 Tax=Pseudoalteromonas byunsanensis TaxID=327939 RepID=A0A1S1N0D0_9GAMM|nr:questin oxidase family protein [Pseudoalteromonas byunsanensis]OHU93459.1 hypothetical protein BIW53_19065 [Pseudoalteromonas byunsanensis]
MNNKDTLKQLMAQLEDYQPLYSDRMASHLPMVLSALSYLGATAEHLARFYHSDIHSLRKRTQPKATVHLTYFHQHLGSSAHYEHYLAYFQTQVSQFGVSHTLRQTLDTLIKGVSASAFHALIRLAYALEFNHQQEIVIALSYWCCEYQPFSVSDEMTEETMDETLKRLSKIGEQHVFSPGIIVDRMDEISHQIAELTLAIQPKEIDINSLRRFCLRHFYQHNDFTLLHTVTGCHALERILPYISDKDAALRYMWQAVVMACLSTGLNFSQNEKYPLNTEHGDFSPLVAAALKSNDDHMIKLIYTCLRDFKKYGEPIYYTLAKRAAYD